jgi:hypothetical protein
MIIIAVRGAYNQTRIWRKPSPIAVFTAWFSWYGFTAELSSSGRIASQVIEAIGGLRGAQIEIDADDPKRKGSVRAYAVPRPRMLEILSKSRGSSQIGNNLLASLVHFKVLVVGLRLQCPECRQITSYRLADLDSTLKCDRCL